MNNPIKKEIKDVIQSFKVTKTESKMMKAKAKKLGVSTSTYIRYVVEKDLAMDSK